MIKTVADLLQSFMKEESAKLSVYELKHGPTIGDMYEGLSADLLSRAIPPQLNLQIVDGFITDGADFLSGQIDCMLVRGEGEKIPFTKSFKWHVKDVLAVFEVKKNLYSADLINSFNKLRQASEGYTKYLFDGEHGESGTINLSPSYKTFSQLTGIKAPQYHDRETLSKENELIYTTVFMEQLMPVKIVIGYDGFSSEYSLREGMAKFLEEQGSGSGYGIPSFPQLIICGEHSLVKATGQPYTIPMRDGYWDFMLSSKANPVLLMLEFIWTKLSLEFDVGLPWGDDLEMEGLNEFLRAKPVINGEQGGWMFKYDELSKSTLEKRSSTVDWQPIEISTALYVIFQRLTQGEVSVLEPDFIQFIAQEGLSVEEFISQIISTNYVAFGDNKLSLTTENLVTAILPDGRFVVAENNSGRFDAWLNIHFPKI
ncbi:DUF6602 domain-containing protein [Aliivibrio fischeri]|uniref:DUF6602 domain-containing protein n=1 Tax=Aliivibrio fischeri TaxID=668 RepID=UPI0012DA2BE9|nr:DUF6602 domain-containing protein [Aliivibrio fischeri]MUL11859.1 hypothetical protein [Aliivibrio fischeri]MUL15357.1 hypothetical protein [Aliivibrio fischeri]